MSHPAACGGWTFGLLEWGVVSAAACTATAAVEVIESWTLLTVEFGSLAAANSPLHCALRWGGLRTVKEICGWVFLL